MSSDDNDLGLDDDNFDSFEKKKMTVGDMWREKPLFKVGAIVVAAVVVFGMIIMFGGGSAELPVGPSALPSGSEVAAPPGTDEASQAYIEAVQEQNDARTEEAQAEGGSSLPTPIDPPVGRVTPEDSGLAQDDPLQRWRALQEERLARELSEVPETVEVQEPPENRAEQIQQMATAMSTQMQAILEKNSQVKTGYRSITDPSFLEELNAKEEESDLSSNDGSDSSDLDDSTVAVDVEEIIMPAGEIAYAQMITTANSDVKGPVLAQIAGGPLNGARVIGDFKLEEQPEVLTLSFDTAIVDGISYDIDAVALDPNTTLPGMATDVDHHYFKRIVLPAAAAFVKGMAEAISESGSTTVTIDSGAAVSGEEDKNTDQEVASGIEEGGQKLSQILDWQAAKSKLTVIVDAGTPIGILFLEPVVKKDQDQVYSPVARSTRAMSR